MSDENLYAVRDEIVARLEQFMDEWGVKKIYTPKNLGVTTELSQITPNIQVNFRRTKSAGVVSKGDALKLKVVWEVTVCCKHAASQVTDGSKAFDMAGDLTIKIIKKLSGWEPESSAEPLIYMNTEEDISKSCVYSTVVLESELFIQSIMQMSYGSFRHYLKAAQKAERIKMRNIAIATRAQNAINKKFNDFIKSLEKEQ